MISLVLRTEYRDTNKLFSRRVIKGGPMSALMDDFLKSVFVRYVVRVSSQRQSCEGPALGREPPDRCLSINST